MTSHFLEEIKLEEILVKLEEPLRTKVSELLSNAMKKAKMIIEGRKKEAYRMAKRRVHDQLFLKRSIEIGKIEKEKRTELLRLKQEIFEKMYEMVKERLQKIVNGEDPQYDYYKVLYNILKEAAREINEDVIYVQANARDLKYLKSVLDEIQTKMSQDLGRNIKIVLEETPIECIGGIIAKSKDGKRIFYGTLDGKLNEILRRYRSKINRILFQY